ncbi:hypothetical protein [Pseudomonas sp. 65/3-MNA-CIBAN-0223]|uniref:hypothetical protein n=1 Tax=unclassified Pseudomonas TaxID=196821 RepID=UPI00331E8521
MRQRVEPAGRQRRNAGERNGSATYEGHCVKLQGERRILRTGYKRLLEMSGSLDPQWSITSAPIN